MSKPIGIGLAGFGTVGAGVYKNLQRNGALLEQRIGRTFEVKKIAVRDLSKARDVQAPVSLFTSNPDEILVDPSIQIVVELMGGIDVPLAFVKKAIAAGKIVVTGNKALLAEHGNEIFELGKMLLLDMLASRIDLDFMTDSNSVFIGEVVIHQVRLS